MAALSDLEISYFILREEIEKAVLEIPVMYIILLAMIIPQFSLMLCLSFLPLC